MARTFRQGAKRLAGTAAAHPIKTTGGVIAAGAVGKGAYDEAQAASERAEMAREQAEQNQRAEEQFRAALEEQHRMAAGQQPVAGQPAVAATQPTAQRPPGPTPGPHGQTAPAAAGGPAGARPPTQQQLQQIGQQAQQAGQQAMQQYGARPGQPMPPQAQQQGLQNLANQAPPQVQQQGPQGIMDWAYSLWNAIPEGMRWPLVGGIGLGALSLLSGLGGGGGERGSSLLGGIGPLLAIGGLGLGGYAAYKGGLFDQFLPPHMQAGRAASGAPPGATPGAPPSAAPAPGTAPPVTAPGAAATGAAPGERPQVPPAGQQAGPAGQQVGPAGQPAAPGQQAGPAGQPAAPGQQGQPGQQRQQQQTQREVEPPPLSQQTSRMLGDFRRVLNAGNPTSTMLFLKNNVLNMSPEEQQAAMQHLSDQEWDSLQAQAEDTARRFGGWSSDAARAPAMVAQKRQEAMQLRQARQAQAQQAQQAQPQQPQQQAQAQQAQAQQAQMQQAAQRLRQRFPGASQNMYQALAGMSPIAQEVLDPNLSREDLASRLRQELANRQNVSPDQITDEQVARFSEQIFDEQENARIKAQLADHTGLSLDKITPDMVASTRNAIERERIRHELAEERGESPEQISEEQITRRQQREREPPTLMSEIGRTGLGMATEMAGTSALQAGASRLMGSAAQRAATQAATAPAAAAVTAAAPRGLSASVSRMLPAAGSAAAFSVLGDIADRLGILPEFLGGEETGPMTAHIMQERINQYKAMEPVLRHEMARRWGEVFSPSREDRGILGTIGDVGSALAGTGQYVAGNLAGALDVAAHPITTLEVAGRQIAGALSTPQEEKYYRRPIDLNIFGEGGPAAWWRRVEIPIDPRKWLPF